MRIFNIVKFFYELAMRIFNIVRFICELAMLIFNIVRFLCELAMLTFYNAYFLRQQPSWKIKLVKFFDQWTMRKITTIAFPTNLLQTQLRRALLCTKTWDTIFKLPLVAREQRIISSDIDRTLSKLHLTKSLLGTSS
jgi:hypothetical protein